MVLRDLSEDILQIKQERSLSNDTCGNCILLFGCVMVMKMQLFLIITSFHVVDEEAIVQTALF